MVTCITEEGFLMFQPLVGWWSQVLPAQRVEVLTRKGKVLGVIGSKAPHTLSKEDKNRSVTLEHLYVDIGAESREEAETMGIRPGDPVAPISPFTELGNPNRWLAKAMDNRLGCAVLVEVMERLKEKNLPN
jgi:endoglucanase